MIKGAAHDSAVKIIRKNITTSFLLISLSTLPCVFYFQNLALNHAAQRCLAFKINITTPGETRAAFSPGVVMRQAQRVSKEQQEVSCSSLGHGPKPQLNLLKELSCCFAIWTALFANFDDASALARLELRLT